MTSLENFLNKKNKTVSSNMEPASGSFQCQNQDCNEVVNDGYVDKSLYKLYWTCQYGHESSVPI
jgi:uncharacterized lipoprotein YddW (UPF0748 family)